MKTFGLEFPYWTHTHTHTSVIDPLVQSSFLPGMLEVLRRRGFLEAVRPHMCLYTWIYYVWPPVTKCTQAHTHRRVLRLPSSLFLLPTSAAELIPRMPLMEYEEPAESLVTAETCVAATDVAADRQMFFSEWLAGFGFSSSHKTFAAVTCSTLQYMYLRTNETFEECPAYLWKMRVSRTHSCSPDKLALTFLSGAFGRIHVEFLFKKTNKQTRFQLL